MESSLVVAPTHKVCRLNPIKTRTTTAHTFHLPTDDPKFQNAISWAVVVKTCTDKISSNYRMPANCLISFETKAWAVASRLQFENCLRVVSAEAQKIRGRQNWPGWIFFVTNCPGLSYIYHIKLIRRSKRPISSFRHSGRPEAATSGRNLGLKISPIESPWKVGLTLQKF